jgi:hypothetical protein
MPSAFGTQGIEKLFCFISRILWGCWNENKSFDPRFWFKVLINKQHY